MCSVFAEYVNKIVRGISNLQKDISNVMNSHPEFDVVDVARNFQSGSCLVFVTRTNV